MRCVILPEPNHPVVVEDVDPTPPGPDDIVLRTLASGVCHTDLHVAQGLIPAGAPLILGHEGVGVVEEVGSGISDIAVGDTVVVATVGSCGSCYWCSAGQPNLCPRRWNPARAHRSDGSEVSGFAGLGTFSDRLTVDKHLAVVVRTDLPAEQLALLGCGVMTGVGAVLNTASAQAGDTVAIIGCGGVGLSAVQGAVIAGASQIVAIDPLPSKRDMALELGATVALDPTCDVAIDAVAELTGGRGADVAVDFVGSATTILDAWRMTRRGGTTVVVGTPSPSAVVELPAMELMLSEKRLTGCIFGSARIRHDIPRLAALAANGRLDLGGMVSRRIGIDDVSATLEAMEGSSDVRSVVTSFA